MGIIGSSPSPKVKKAKARLAGPSVRESMCESPKKPRKDWGEGWTEAPMMDSGMCGGGGGGGGLVLTAGDDVEVNVGGKVFALRLATLRAHAPGSVLTRYFEHRPPRGRGRAVAAAAASTAAAVAAQPLPTDEFGRPHFANRDAASFAALLALLAHGELPAGAATVSRCRLKADAQFFGLAELARRLEADVDEVRLRGYEVRARVGWRGGDGDVVPTTAADAAPATHHDRTGTV